MWIQTPHVQRFFFSFVLFCACRVSATQPRHPGSFDIVSVKDGAGHVFATRLQNIFSMGHGTRAMVRELSPRRTIRLKIRKQQRCFGVTQYTRKRCVFGATYFTPLALDGPL